MKPYLLLAWIGLLAGLAPSGSAAPGEEDALSPEAWLERMEHAVSGMNYRGTLVNLRDGRVDTLRIIHRVDDNGVRERIYALDGKPREILRDRDSVRCLLGETGSIVIPNEFPARLLPQLPVDRMIDRESIYELDFAGRGRVAGLDVRIIEVRPLDGYRYGHRLWLEERTAMPLRAALLDEHGGIIQQLSFVDIELSAQISDAEFEPGLAQFEEFTGFLSPPEGEPDRKRLSEPSWLPEQLPKGFRLATVGRSAGPGGRSIEHLLYSDGLASFSIYIEDIDELEGPPVAQSLETMGPVHVYTGKVENKLVTVVGEVPAATVATIGRHVRRAGTPVVRQ